MLPQTERKITFPVSPEDWCALCGENGFPHPKMDKSSNLTTTAQNSLNNGSGPGALLRRVHIYEGYCVYWSVGSPNVPTQVNNMLSKVKSKDGLTITGNYHVYQKKDYYLKLQPRLLQLNRTSIEDVFPSECRSSLESILRVEPPYNDAIPFLIFWTLSSSKNPRKKSFSDEEFDNNRGSQVKSVLSKKHVNVFSSKLHEDFVSHLRKSLGLSFEVHSLVVDATLTKELEKIDPANTEIVFVEESLDDVSLGLILGFVNRKRLFFVVYEDDENSLRRCSQVCDRFHLPGAIIQKVARRKPATGLTKAITELCNSEFEREHNATGLQRSWLRARQLIDNMLDEQTVNLEIIENIVVKPLELRASKLSRGKFLSEMNPQDEFVRAATPLYSQAKQIYALNTDRYSTFWRRTSFDEEQRKRYLMHCPTVRLFLYSSFESLCRDVSNLNHQATHYSSGGAKVSLLVGDRSCFTQLCQNSLLNEKLVEDVAFIQLISGEWYRFELDEGKVEYEKIGTEIQDPLLDQLRALESIQSEKGGKHNGFNFFKWDRDIQKSTLFPHFVSQTFPSNTVNGAHRVITFRNDGSIDPERFSAIILSVRQSLGMLYDYFKENFGLRGIEHGAASRRNGLTRSHDRNETQNVLILHFDNDQHLEAFSKSDQVMAIRNRLNRELLEALNMNEVSEETLKALTIVGNRFVTVRDYHDRFGIAAWTEVLSKGEVPA